MRNGREEREREREQREAVHGRGYSVECKKRNERPSRKFHRPPCLEDLRLAYADPGTTGLVFALSILLVRKRRPGCGGLSIPCRHYLPTVFPSHASRPSPSSPCLTVKHRLLRSLDTPPPSPCHFHQRSARLSCETEPRRICLSLRPCPRPCDAVGTSFGASRLTIALLPSHGTSLPCRLPAWPSSRAPAARFFPLVHPPRPPPR